MWYLFTDGNSYKNGGHIVLIYRTNKFMMFSIFPFSSSNGSATSEDLFWKLDALQMFVFDLHWPEQEFAHHLEQRLKLMASDMIEACVKR